MTFTLYSAAILLILFAAILIEVLRGMKKGFLKMAVRLGTVLGSILIALPLSLWAGDIPAGLLTSTVMKIRLLRQYAESIAGLDELITAYVDALISPILFVILFFVIRAILSLVVSIVYKKKLCDSRSDAGYATSEDAWYHKHHKLYGALTGALIGLVTTVCLLMPLTGTLRTASALIDCTAAAGANLSKMGIPEALTSGVRDYANDAPSAVLYACGGNLMYYASSSFELEGERYALVDEIDGIRNAASDMRTMLKVFTSKKTELTDEDKQSIKTFQGAIEASGTVRFVAAGFLSEAAETWLDGSKYLGMGRPTFGKVVDPVITEMLAVYKTTDTSVVSADISTLLNLYVIVTEQGMIRNPDYEALVKKMGETTLMDDICNELEANPRTAYISDLLTDMIVRTVSSAINLSEVDEVEYEKLLVNLADSLNALKDESDEVKKARMTEYIVQHADEYGVELPANMATVTAQYMVEEIDSSNGDVSTEEVKAFLDRHSVDGK